RDLRPAAAQGHYETLLDAAALDAWFGKLERADLVCIDTETTSLEPMNAQLVGLSFSIEPLHAAYLPLTHRYAGAPEQLDIALVLGKLKAWFEDASKHKVGQNLKYD